MLLLLPLSSCRRTPEAKTRTAFALDTVISVTYYDDKDGDAVRRVMAKLPEYERIFSRTDPDSELAKINASYNVAMPCSEDLFAVLLAARRFAEESNGGFDFTLGGVSDLYGFGSGKTRRVPSAEELQTMLSHAGYEKVLLDETERTVTRLDAGLSIDLGAIAKGYVADRMKDELKAAGVRRALLNLGGNVLLLGDKDGNEGLRYSTGRRDGLFAIGIKDPDSETPLKTLYLADMSLVTSGTYERSFRENGLLYHHILAPETGLPVRNGLLSVSVAAPDSMTADALSTACFVLGEEGSRNLLRHYPDVTVIFVSEEKELLRISGKEAE